MVFILTVLLFLPAFSVVSMFKPKKCGGKEEYKFLEQFVSNSKLKVMSCSQIS